MRLPNMQYSPLQPAFTLRTISVEIISGNLLGFLMKKDQKFVQVKVDFIGGPTDCHSFATNLELMDPLQTRFTGNKAFEVKITCPETTFMHFVLSDEDGQLIGQKVMRLFNMNTGFRCLVLEDKNGKIPGAPSLFFKIKVSNL
uniref:Uncharacterized protein n=1 Tax=Ditylenchus dipsaci TaxID=166011 RepID=A0A915D0W2_9BILA